jgi:hypothetical protein
MATWGKITIRPNPYDERETLYYSYSTTVDSYYICHAGYEDLGMSEEYFKREYRFGKEAGEAMMEALINHTMAFEGLTEEQFVERYIRNNRFKKVKE